jgi:hypothetical protein
LINELHRAIEVFTHVMMVSTFAFAVAIGVNGASGVSPKGCVTCIAKAKSIAKPTVAEPKPAILKVRNS